MKKILILCFVLLLAGCSEQAQPPVTIAINPWPGYELLYLAEKRGYFKQVGADVRLVQLSSLSDAQRAYMNGHVDGFASTLIEAVQAHTLSDRPLQIVMVPDYSAGGDVIVGSSAYADMTALRGKRIGGEVSSLGIYFLQRALLKSGMKLSDVAVVNIEQGEGKEALASGKIDAFVGYPPVSVAILEDSANHVIFSSAQIPEEIIDVVSLSSAALAEHPGLVEKLFAAWDLAMKDFHDNPSEAAAIMAGRQGISVEDFMSIITEELVVMSSRQQQVLLGEGDKLRNAVVDVCTTLTAIGSLQSNCDHLEDVIYSVARGQ